MTNKEASKVLEHIKFNENYELYIDKEDVEAINLAIQALEQVENNTKYGSELARIVAEHDAADELMKKAEEERIYE